MIQNRWPRVLFALALTLGITLSALAVQAASLLDVPLRPWTYFEPNRDWTYTAIEKLVTPPPLPPPLF